MFGRRKLFPYTAFHLGRRVAWVVGRLRLVPSASTHSSLIMFDDRLHDRTGDKRQLMDALRLLEHGVDGEQRDQREELKYVRIHLRHCGEADAYRAFKQGYLEGRPAWLPMDVADVERPPHRS